MATKSNDKSEWNALIQKVKAIRELGIAKARELAEFIGSPEQRLTEWINGHKEPRAEKTLLIQAWVKIKEGEMLVDGKLPAFKKILKRLANET